MSFRRRLARLEASRPDATRDLHAMVLRAFQGDRNAGAAYAQRLRKALDLDNKPVGAPIDFQRLLTADPELRAAAAAVPKEIRDEFVRQAEERFGETMESLLHRMGYREVNGEWALLREGDTGLCHYDPE